MTARHRLEVYSKWAVELKPDNPPTNDNPPSLQRYVCVEADHRGGTWLTFRDSIGEACQYLSGSAKEGGFWPEFIIDLDQDMKRSIAVAVVVTPEEEHIVPVLMRREEIAAAAHYLAPEFPGEPVPQWARRIIRAVAL